MEKGKVLKVVLRPEVLDKRNIMGIKFYGVSQWQREGVIMGNHFVSSWLNMEEGNDKL